jgi:hypothetical protein
MQIPKINYCLDLGSRHALGNHRLGTRWLYNRWLGSSYLGRHRLGCLLAMQD